MYLCLAEATKAIVSAVKPVSNKDKTHTGQFEYSVWMELVRDSAEITMRHGLYAQPKKEMKTLVGELNNFHLLWTAPTKATKDKVKTHVRDMFSPKAKLLTTIGHRSLGQFSLYEDRKWPISGIQMVIHAYKVKQEKKNKHDCILTGGKYLPFDDVADDIRDTIHFKQDGCPHPVKAEHFHDLSLNSDSELLNPQVLATAIYIDKSITDDERGKARKLRGRYLSWKSAQKKKNPAYVKIIHFKEADICDSGGGGGGERNKRITKGELIKPMEDLAGQFCELHDYIDDENARAKDYLTGTMTDTFNRIAEIVNVHTQPVYDLETDSDESEPDDDGSSDSSEEEEEEGEGESEGEGEEEGGGEEEKKKKDKMKKKTNKKENKEKAKKKTTKTTKKTHDEDENEGDDVENAKRESLWWYQYQLLNGKVTSQDKSLTPSIDADCAALENSEVEATARKVNATETYAMITDLYNRYQEEGDFDFLQHFKDKAYLIERIKQFQRGELQRPPATPDDATTRGGQGGTMNQKRTVTILKIKKIRGRTMKQEMKMMLMVTTLTMKMMRGRTMKHEMKNTLRMAKD